MTGFDGKLKALTFSYDDGVLQDERLVRIFNKYGLKATFNINSGCFEKPGRLNLDGVEVDHTKIKASDVKSLYLGHEVAAHTVTHPNLCGVSEEEIISQVEEDRLNLSRLVDYNVCGFAYPGGGTNHDERVAKIVKEHTGVRYARTIISSRDFEPQTDLYRFKPTLYHIHLDEMFALGERFIDLKPDRPQLFYIWGHSYEFDVADTWDKFEEFCKIISGRNDIFYGTNKEVLVI